jgi:glycerophosphoryl diester phosphodiesterase
MDDCGASENSIEVLRLARRLGASGVEIDVRVTSDGVAVLYHDTELSPRLVRGRFCVGPLEDFSHAHLQAFCRLQFGELIPTLDEALRTVVRDTALEAVWLDVKTPAAMVASIDSVRRAQALAASLGRSVHFGVGLAEEATVDAWMTAGAPADIRCLCELEPDDVRRAGCEVWAPRWTRGPLTAEVAAMQAEGVAVAFWTLDEPVFIDLILEDARPDAILTNRAGVVAHRLQSIGHLTGGLVP